MEKTSSKTERERNAVTDFAFSQSDDDLRKSLLDQMRSGLRQLAGPREHGDTWESMLNRAARRAGISFRTAKTLFYSETSEPRATVVIRVQRAVAELQHKQEAKARDEYRSLADAIEAVVLAAHPNMDRTSIAEAVGALAERSPVGRALDRE